MSIISKETNIIASNSNFRKRRKLSLAKILKLDIKNIYPNYQTLYPYRSNC